MKQRLLLALSCLALLLAVVVNLEYQTQAYSCKQTYWCDNCTKWPEGTTGDWREREECCSSGSCSAGYTGSCTDVNECGSCGSVKKQCADGSKVCGDCPEDARAFIKGRVARLSATCPDGQSYYGGAQSCGNSDACVAGPNYTVSYRRTTIQQTASSGNNQCVAGLPNYDFGDAGPRTNIPLTGEPMEISIQVDPQAGQEWGVTHWGMTSVDGSGKACAVQHGVFAQKSLNQTFTGTIYAANGCNQNHLWFYNIETIKVAGCFYDKATGKKVSEVLQNATYPKVAIEATWPTVVTPSADGCFELSDFVRVNSLYRVAPENTAPAGYKAPATVSNLASFVHYTPDGATQPIGPIPPTWTSYEAQKPKASDCGENCDFVFEKDSNPQGVPDCTLLSGPTTLTPGQVATYQVTADDSRAPVSAVELSGYGTSCSNQVRPYAPQSVAGGGTYSFNWTAPAKPGIYTLYGRVWNNNISECRSDCVDGPPRSLCASATQCKMQVTVGNPAPVKPRVSCGSSGTLATFSWPEIPGAQRYVLRIDKTNSCPGVATGHWFCGPNQVVPPNNNPYGEDQYVIYKADTVCNSGVCTVERGIVANDDYLNASIQWVPSASGNITADSNYMDFSDPFSCPDPANQTITITGTIREGSAQKYGPNNYCADSSKPPIAVPGTVTLSGAPPSAQNPSGTPPNTQNLNGGTTFSFPISVDPTGTQRTLSLSNLTTTICACEGVGCNYTIPTDTPGTYTYDFFVSKYSDASWWQASGGTIYAGGGMASAIPTTCTSPGCNPFLVLLERYPYSLTQQHLLSAGVPIASGPLFTGSGDATERSYSQTRAKLPAAPTISPTENYEYFAQKIALETIPEQTGSTITELSQLNPTIWDGVAIAKFSGTLTLAPQTTWNIPGGTPSTAKKYLIFADTVTITDEHDLKELITVEEGGFFMVVTKRDITIDPSVGDLPTEKTVNLEGVFVAGENLNIQSDGDAATQDLQFIGAGSFVGWGNIRMYRQYKDDTAGALLNNTVPSEFFIFRPDFVRSVPASLKDSQTVWREIK